MRIRLLRGTTLVVTLARFLAAPPVVRAEAPPSLAPELSARLNQARSALQSDQAAKARELLRAIVRDAPGTVPALQLLGAAEEALGDPPAALTAYGKALATAPGDDYSTQRVRAVCRGGLPLELPAGQRDPLFSVLGEAPLRVRELEVDTGRVRFPPGDPLTRRAFHTTGILFAPPAMTRDPSHRKASTLPEDLTFNRVCYGYALEPAGATWRLRFRVHYVSEFLAGSAYQTLAEGTCDLFLRLYWLGQDGIGVETRFAPDGVVDVWLLPKGEPGGEHSPQYTEDLFFYGIEVARPGLEWIREVAHEYGHHVIPPVDGYSGIAEPWATGTQGERLFLTWLSELGFGLGDSDTPFTATAEGYREYLRQQVLSDANFFLNHGPSETLSADQTDNGWRYTQGFLTYVNGQYGNAALAETYRGGRKLAPGEFMTGIDLLRAFQEVRNRAAEPIDLRPGFPIPSLSGDTDAVAGTGTSDESLPLQQDATLAWWVYLAAGDWELSLVPTASVEATLALGLGKPAVYERSLVLSPPPKEAQWVPLGTLATGWHVLRVRGTNVPKPLALKLIRLRLRPGQ